MDFKVKTTALMVGIAGTIIVLLMTLFLGSSMLLNAVDRAYIQGEQLSSLIGKSCEA